MRRKIALETVETEPRLRSRTWSLLLWIILCWGSVDSAWAQLPTPTLVSPSNGATGVSTTPLLDWSDVTGASTYRVFVSASQSTLSVLSATTTTCSGCLVNTTTSSSSYTVGSGVLSNATTYYWMVRAGGASGGSPNSAIRSFTTVAGSLPTPSLVSPSNGATGVSTTPLLDWSDVTGASTYRVFVSASQSTLSVLSATTTTCSGCLVNTTTSSSSYTVGSGVLSNATTYYWMVRAGGASGGSPNSAIRSFTTVAGSLPTPSLVSPSNGATGVSTTPLLDWSDVTGASTYRVFVSASQSTLSVLSATTTTCSGCLVNTTTSSSSYTVGSGVLSNATTYYWMVRAGGASGGSPNSSIRSFTTVAGSLPTPTLVSPSNGVAGVSTTPLLDWSTVSGATKYRVFVSTSQAVLSSLGPTATTCTGCVINQEILSGSSSSYQIASGETLAAATIYYWMVRAGSTSAGSPNSAIWSFTTAAGSLPTPTLVSPSNVAANVSTTPLLDWSTVSGATKYRVFVSTSQAVLSSLGPTATTCTGCVLNQEIFSGSSSSYQIASGQALASATTYYWMVRAGSTSAGSPNSAIWSFTTAAVSLLRPTLQSPSNGAQGVSTLPTLSWSSVPDAQRYRVFVSTSQSTLAALTNTATTCSGCIVNGELTTATSYPVQSAQRLASGTIYYWLVRAGSDEGGSPNSAIWSFTTASGTTNSPTSLVPLDGSQNHPVSGVVFGWSLNNPASSISRVELTLREGDPTGGALGSFVGDCQQKRIGVVSSYPSASCGALRAATWYRYTVELVFSDGTTRTGASAFFRTEASWVARFEFAPIPLVQEVSVPFSVTITAVDEGGAVVSDFDGEVRLSCPHAAISPNQVQFVGGVWAGMVSLDASTALTRLSASLGPRSGESGEFSVLSLEPVTGSIDGRVVNRVGPADAQVRLFNTEGVLIRSTASNTAGWFVFSDLAPGTYFAEAVRTETMKSVQESVIVPGGGSASVILDLVGGRRPVVLVPGIMGSTVEAWYRIDLTPMLPKERAEPDQLSILDPFSVPGFKDLRAHLEDAGYEVFDAPWDWREPVETAWPIYLKRVIDQAKHATGFGKVDIVAHSMGGLLARSYIQGESYSGDVDKLALVGTPNHGAAIAYYIVEGGDPKRADDLTDKLLIDWINFYARVTNDLHWTMEGSPAFALDSTLFSPFLWDFDRLSPGVTHKSLRDFFYNNVFAAVQLLPVYSGALEGGSVASLSHVNQTLASLNLKDPCIRLAGENGPATQVRTKLFLSDDQATLKTVKVGAPGTDGTYPWGKPFPDDEQELPVAGDGTVIARLPEPDQELACLSRAPGTGPHALLVGKLKCMVAEFLNSGRTDVVQPLACDSVARLETLAPASLLSLAVSGRVQPVLIDPQGRRSGFDPQSELVRKEIPGSEVLLGAPSSGIHVDDPASGLYRIELSGLHTENEEVAVTIFFRRGEERFERSFRLFYHGGAGSILIQLEPSATDPIRLSSRQLFPSSVATLGDQGETVVTWQPSATPGAVEYRIYGRQRDQPAYTLLGSTSGTTFRTGQAFLSPGSEATWRYVVVGRSAAGEESVFFDVASNVGFQTEPGTCTPVRALQCGGADSWSTVNGANSIQNYACLTRTHSGPEVAYVFEPASDTHVELSLGGLSADLDLIVLGDAGAGCQAGTCLSHNVKSGTAGETVRFGAVGGHRYYVLVDGVDGASGAYDLQVSCTGPTFSDVSSGFWAFQQIQALYNAGVTTGCAVGSYCPAAPVTRDQMAAFLERALRGRYFVPPAATGLFSDVPADFWAAGWIEQLYQDGVTTGCAANPPRYCPSSLVTRDQMAVFLLRAKHGAGYVPPAATGVFSDVPAGFWAEAWIEQLYREGITTGCAANPARYCPENAVTRAEMAVFLTRAFGFPLP